MDLSYQRTLVTSSTKITMASFIWKVRGKLRETDWKGLSVWTKARVLASFSLRPWHTWQKDPRLLLRALELDNNELCTDMEALNIIFSTKYQNRNISTLMTFREMINLYQLAKQACTLEGGLAEIGVFQGGSATILGMVKGDKELHLFDTWEGLPDPDSEKDILKAGEMSETSLDLVKKNMKDFSNVHFHQGMFPDTAGPVEDKKFCFVNMDTDLYEGTKACLEFFYPRMARGGILLSHDYNDSRTPGVKTAFDEFGATVPEPVIPVWDTQAMMIKM